MPFSCTCGISIDNYYTLLFFYTLFLVSSVSYIISFKLLFLYSFLLLIFFVFLLIVSVLTLRIMLVWLICIPFIQAFTVMKGRLNKCTRYEQLNVAPAEVLNSN